MSKKVKSTFAFTDGSKVYKEFNKGYKTHTKGYVILGPPGIGKTWYVKNQKGKKDWVDSDDLLGALGVKWHQNQNNKLDFRLNYLRADYILEQSKLLGYRIIGALFWEYKADAMVIPPMSQHMIYMKKRKDLNEKKLKNFRKIFKDHAIKFQIPIFESIEDAVEHLTK
uniref:Uncharacterized protein n=1 Tax=Megaviridae environmental sample TaxID=1737588 RepID=A0A5J6VLS6_9VIRU|nr:MAG: hypothetical protein [Megaviridae environmental sample]